MRVGTRKKRREKTVSYTHLIHNIQRDIFGNNFDIPFRIRHYDRYDVVGLNLVVGFYGFVVDQDTACLLYTSGSEFIRSECSEFLIGKPAWFCNYFCCMYGVFFGGFLVFKKETLVLKITYFKILLTKLDINGKEYFLSNRQGKYRGE